jgi:hypothetical protein
MTAAQVRATWGSGYAVCRGCEHRTWYYNYAPFSPQGAGVELRGGRVVAVFTLSSPSGWRTTRGLTLGDAAARITAVYGATNRADCGAYYALLLPRGRTVSAFYVVKDRLWAFALLRSPSPPCR